MVMQLLPQDYFGMGVPKTLTPNSGATVYGMKKPPKPPATPDYGDALGIGQPGERSAQTLQFARSFPAAQAEAEAAGFDPLGEYQRRAEDAANYELAVHELGQLDQAYPNQAPQSGGGGGIFRLVRDAANFVGETPLVSQAVKPLSLPLGLGLEAAQRSGVLPKGPTAGEAADLGFRAYNADVPYVSDFMRNTVRPLAGDIAEPLAEYTYNATVPVGVRAGAKELLGTTGTEEAGGVGRGAAESLTPVSAGDIALSLLLPATADWGDIYRAAKASGLLDEAGRVVANSPATQRLVARLGASVDDIATAFRTAPLPDIPRVGTRMVEAPASVGAESIPMREGGLPSVIRGGAQEVTEHPVDPVAKLSELIDTARPLPELTEAERHTERVRRVAIGASQLEAGGRSPEAYQAARGALGGEYPRAAFEAPLRQFDEAEVQQLRQQLADADLRFFEEINTEQALNKVLEGRLNEVIPSEIKLLDQVYGPKLSLQVAEKAMPPGFGDKLYEFWLSSILSGPLTQARNIVGNTTAALSAIPERFGAAALEQGIAKAQGRAPTRFFEEAPAQLFGMMRGLPEGIRGALRIMKGGIGESALTEAAKAPAIGGLKGRIIRIPLTGLEAMDAFFRGINFEGAKSALAVRIAKSEGLTGEALNVRIADLMANPTDEMLEKAAGEATYRLFRDEPTRYGQAIMDFRNKAPGSRFVIPFARTPDRLLAYGIRRSPLGLFDVPMWQRLAKGNPEAVDELAQTLMGSTVASGLAAMVATGQMDITGAVPVNAAERDRFFREGKVPFAVKVPGIGWVQFNQIPNLDSTLSTLAAAAESFRQGGEIDDLVTQTGATIAQNIFDKSYYTGLSDFMDIFSGGLESPEDAAMRWAGRNLSGFVPFSATTRQTAGFFDQTVRRPEGFGEQIATGTGFGELADVPARLNAFGQEARRPFPSPVTISPASQSQVDAELERLGLEVGFVGDSIGGYDLDREQQYLYQKAAGKLTLKELVNDIVLRPDYQDLSDVQKAELIDYIVQDSRRRVRQGVNDILERNDFYDLTPQQQKQVIDSILEDAVKDAESPLR